MSGAAPPAGFEPAHTAPEAAVASMRIYASDVAASGRISDHVQDRSVYVPDHGQLRSLLASAATTAVTQAATAVAMSSGVLSLVSTRSGMWMRSQFAKAVCFS